MHAHSSCQLALAIALCLTNGAALAAESAPATLDPVEVRESRTRSDNQNVIALSAREQMEARPHASLRDARRYQEVLGALDALEHNSPPVLALEAMVARLRRV